MGGRGKILVVENEEAIRDLLQLILSAEGYDVVHAMHGAEGLEQATLHRPDLILLDVKMPELDGIEFAHRYTGGAPLVVLTAAQVERVAGQIEACAYLAKPFELEQLLATIQSCFPREVSLAN